MAESTVIMVANDCTRYKLRRLHLVSSIGSIDEKPYLQGLPPGAEHYRWKNGQGHHLVLLWKGCQHCTHPGIQALPTLYQSFEKEGICYVPHGCTANEARTKAMEAPIGSTPG